MVPSRFLSLPLELREDIYSILLNPEANRTRDDLDGTVRYHYDHLNLLLVSRQVHEEASKVFRRLNVFARIETPFPEAEHHIAIEGYVPIVASGPRAERFPHWHLRVMIDAPAYHFSHPDACKILIHLDDLASFCRMWFYSSLSYPGLNFHLSLKLLLRNPYAAPFDDDALPKALQKRLLEPFGMVKGVHEVNFDGNYYKSIEKSVRTAMAENPVSPTQCIVESTKLKDEGNLALKDKRYKDAIALYVKAFEAIHIVCVGRRRSVWADAYFQGVLQAPYEGQHAEMVRLVLRAKLVANVVYSYLKLEEYDEALFWGMRTIQLIRQAMGFSEDGEDDEPIMGFAAAEQMGKIYYRTGVAYHRLGDKDEARKLLKLAAQYLPNDEEVRKELVSVSPRIG
jgi:tetratricopeptide (TPR) repeat protein